MTSPKNQDPAEGSRDVVEKDLARQGDDGKQADDKKGVEPAPGASQPSKPSPEGAR